MIQTLIIFACVGCEPPPPPPPPCTPGAAYSFHLGSFSAILGFGQVTNVQNSTTINMSVSSSVYSDFRNWVRSYWHKTTEVCGTQYQLEIELQNALLPGVDLLVKKTIIPPGGPGRPSPDDCGTFGAGNGIDSVFEIELISDGGVQCKMPVTAAHEFGHNLGFDDAYSESTLAPLHSQPRDVMTVDDDGVVLGEHLKVISEKY